MNQEDERPLQLILSEAKDRFHKRKRSFGRFAPSG
jgi:hypothetical protein